MSTTAKSLYQAGVSLLSAEHPTEGEIRKAVEHLIHAVENDPGFLDAHVALGNAYMLQERRDLALVEYRKAVGLDKDDATAHFFLALAYYEDDDLQAAVREYREAVRCHADWPEAYFHLGVALKEQGNKKEAFEAFEMFVKTASSDYGPQVKAIKEMMKNELK